VTGRAADVFGGSLQVALAGLVPLAIVELGRTTFEERRALAAAMGADRVTVNRVMRGRAKPGPDFVASLMAALNNDVTLDDLFEIVIVNDSGESL
jgi:Helix-turn-helix.